MVAHPPTPEGQPKEELLQLLMLSVMRLEGRVGVLERRSKPAPSFWKRWPRSSQNRARRYGGDLRPKASGCNRTWVAGIE